MRQKTINLYKFSELSEDSKQKAIERFSDTNLCYDWWDYTYEDAETVGLKITGFDIGRASYCNMETIKDYREISTLIQLYHGEDCETYKTAKQFDTDYNELVKKYSDGVNICFVTEDNEDDFDFDALELEREFLYSISEDYRVILSNEYEYLTSEKAIIESIEANEYEFTEDGILD